MIGRLSKLRVPALVVLALGVWMLLACAGGDRAEVEVWFCPAEGCKDRLVEQIDQAERTLVVACFTFTHYDIAEALVRAVRERGVQVWVVVERSQLDGGIASYLSSRGVPFRVDTNPKLMHHKFTVVDDGVTCTGSFNYTEQADQKNDENLVVIRSGAVAARYRDEFQRLWDAGEAP